MFGTVHTIYLLSVVSCNWLWFAQIICRVLYGNASFTCIVRFWSAMWLLLAHFVFANLFSCAAFCTLLSLQRVSATRVDCSCDVFIATCDDRGCSAFSSPKPARLFYLRRILPSITGWFGCIFGDYPPSSNRFVWPSGRARLLQGDPRLHALRAADVLARGSGALPAAGLGRGQGAPPHHHQGVAKGQSAAAELDTALLKTLLG